MTRALALRLLALAVLSGFLSACGTGQAGSAVATPPAHSAPATTPITAPPGTATATTGIDRLTAVAKRAYVDQVKGPAAQAALNRIATDPAVLAPLRSGNVPALRAYVLPRYKAAWYHWHVSRLRIWHRSRLLIDAGVPFVVAASQRDLHDSHGRYLGTLQVSMQDEIGFVRLMHRRYGIDVVVSGRGGQDFRTSLHAAGNANLPTAGTTTLAGRRYDVRSFTEEALANERVTIWILQRARR